MKSLKQRQDLPSRVRSLLEGLLERAANQFEHAISRTLDEFEQELFKLAERSRSNDQQHARFEALREIKRGRADIAPRFLLHVESTLAHINATAGKSSGRQTRVCAERHAGADRFRSARGRSRAAGNRQQIRDSAQPGALRTVASLRRTRRKSRLGSRSRSARTGAAGARAASCDALPRSRRRISRAVLSTVRSRGDAADRRVLRRRQRLPRQAAHPCASAIAERARARHAGRRSSRGRGTDRRCGEGRRRSSGVCVGSGETTASLCAARRGTVRFRAFQHAAHAAVRSPPRAGRQRAVRGKRIPRQPRRSAVGARLAADEAGFRRCRAAASRAMRRRCVTTC